MHRAAGRFELCHRWLARMQARPELRLDALDADWRAIEALARPVSREIHKMHAFVRFRTTQRQNQPDRKSTRLNSSHLVISYAVFCLKKKKNSKNRFYSTIFAIYACPC